MNAMTWADVQKMRKAGQLEKAHTAASRILSENPQDFRTRTQMEWVIYDFIKRIVEKCLDGAKTVEFVSPRHAAEIMRWMEAYYRAKPEIPGMSCSNILGQLAKVGMHLPRFPGIIKWIGMDGLRKEDWVAQQFNGHMVNSLAMKIAKSLYKWVEAHPDAKEEFVHIALEWVERIRGAENDGHHIWFCWYAVKLLHRLHEFQRAAEILARVIKAKRNESWVWGEAGRLYQHEQPDMALACFCRALECPSDEEFLLPLHRELAKLLAEQENYAQASRELSIIIEIRGKKGWSLKSEEEALISRPWYAAAAEGAEEAKKFYSRHSQAALALCFDRVEIRAANYLGVLVPNASGELSAGRKQKLLSRFAHRGAKGHAWSLIGAKVKNMKMDAGAPVNIVIGHQSAECKDTIMHVTCRDGQHWDCLEQGYGIVVSGMKNDGKAKIMIAETGDEVLADAAANSSLDIGDYMCLRMVRNPKNERIEICHMAPAEVLPDESIIKQIQGELCRHPKGFA